MKLTFFIMTLPCLALGIAWLKDRRQRARRKASDSHYRQALGRVYRSGKKSSTATGTPD